MATKTIRRAEPNEVGGILYLAFELSLKEWRLGFTIGLGQSPRQKVVRAGDLVAVEQEVARAKERFGLSRDARVVSCYEAGRDGFWLHRYLEASGVDNRVVDSCSLDRTRRTRRVKTDSVDLRKLLSMLIRAESGERKVWSVVHVPGVEEEDNRHLHRELDTLKRERTRATNRIRGFLAGQGVRLEQELGKGLVAQLDEIRLWNGWKLPAGLHCRLVREWERIEVLDRQIQELERDRAELVKEWSGQEAEKVRRLLQLKGIGINSAWLFVMEFFGWRTLRNRRQVGALAGLTPTPYQSGETKRDRGISKAGQRLVRYMAIEIAWGWLRFQPRSALSLWYKERFDRGGRRLRKIGIVALARRLLIDLWRYLDAGVIPEGAVLKG